MTKLRKRKETSLGKLQCGTVYRLQGAFHVRILGRLFASPVGLVAGTYEGQVDHGGTRYLFKDSNGTEYVLTPPELTGGFVAARVFALKAV